LTRGCARRENAKLLVLIHPQRIQHGLLDLIDSVKGMEDKQQLLDRHRDEVQRYLNDKTTAASTAKDGSVVPAGTRNSALLPVAREDVTEVEVQLLFKETKASCAMLTHLTELELRGEQFATLSALYTVLEVRKTTDPDISVSPTSFGTSCVVSSLPRLVMDTALPGASFWSNRTAPETLSLMTKRRAPGPNLTTVISESGSSVLVLSVCAGMKSLPSL
jgi:hypothetical protein